MNNKMYNWKQFYASHFEKRQSPFPNYMLRTKLYLPLSAAAAFIAIQVQAQAAITIPTEWKYNELINISGDNIDGDSPYYNEICIAPAAKEEDKKCYDPYDSTDALVIEKWDNNHLSFYAPADLPVNGILTLKLRKSVEKCFGSAGCDFFDEEIEMEIGSYKAVPFVAELIDETTGKKVFSLKANTRYRIKGAFFGENGDIFIQYPKSSKNLTANNIIKWSYNEIVFKTPSGETPLGFSVNNGILAKKYELSENKSSIASSKNSAASSQNSSSLFIDIQHTHAYVDAIMWAKKSGILQGYPDGTFKPDSIVNRAEFLKIVLEAKGGFNPSDWNTPSGFNDVDESGWYAPYVNYAKAQGIIQGYPDGSFKPDQAVNFAEALKMAYNTLGISTNEIGGEWYERFLEHAKLNTVLFSSEARVDAGMSRKDVVWITWKLMNHSGDWKQPSKIVNDSQASSSSAIEFKDGDHIVGTDIEAGTYRTRKGSSGCYYARLSGFSGELDDIIANENTNAPAIITIAPTDKGFKSARCGTWVKDLSAITSSKTSFGDGVFIVGTDIEAGTYRNTGGSFCYYSRLSGFSGELDDIIANENTTSPAIVSIAASDKGFKSARCGTWSKID